MVKAMKNEERLLSRAKAWLEANEKDELGVWDMVQAATNRLENGEDLPQVSLNVLKESIKGTRVRRTLTEDQEAHLQERCESFMAFFVEFPTLKVPRDRLDAEAVFEAFKAAHFDNVKEGAE